MKKHVFDQSVLGLSYRKRRESKGTMVFCSKVVVTETSVSAYVKDKKLDILVIELPLEEIEVIETMNEIAIDSSEYLITVFKDQVSFDDYSMNTIDIAWN